MSAAVGDSTELLDVDVEQLARSLADVPDRDPCRPVLVAQAGQPVADQHVADGRAGHLDDRGQAVRAEPVFVAGGEDRVDQKLGQGPWHPVGPRAPVLEPSLALGLEPPEPLPGRLAAHAGHLGCMGDGHPVDEDPVHEQPTAERRQLGPTMCHESLPFDVS
jgi:hypothetical protein